jgi:hypothetical protein
MLLDSHGQQIVPGGTSTERLMVDPPDSPEQIARWQAALDQMTEEGGGGALLTTLKLVWTPGDWWDPVNRYFIFQMYPKGQIPYWIDEKDLKGPDPRSYAGDYDKILGRFIRIQHISISRQQWSLYHETGQVGVPFWVVQGSNGGHLRHFTQVQSNLAKLEGGNPDPPAPGDLPFARPSQLTFDAIRELDELGKYEGLIAFHLRNPGMIQEGEREKAKAYRERLWNHVRNQQEETYSEQKQFIRAVKDSLPVGLAKSKGADKERIEKNFIDEDHED